MSKQAAYAELRRQIDDINDLLEKARDYAEENDLVMSHKDNSRVSKRDYYGGIDELLEVTTLTDKDVKDWNDSDYVEDAERGFDYGWLPSSLRC